MGLERIGRSHLLELALAASVLVHAGAVRMLPKVSPAKPSASAPVEFVTLPKPPSALAPDEPAPAPEPPPPAPKAEPKRAAPKTTPSPPVDPPPPPRELSGQTLTAEGAGTSFEAPSGDGSSRSTPIEVGSTHVPEPAPKPKLVQQPAPRPTPPPPPPIVRAEDLARRPEPPALAGVLARYYPEEARRRGVGGQAAVRARVDADGVVRSASVTSESEPGFGTACQRTVLGSRWSAPQGRDGRPVATWVRYTCRFRVGL